MPIRLLLPLFLFACDAADPELGQTLPDEQLAAPLPETFTLNATADFVPGQPVEISVTGAPANANLALVRSNGGLGIGPSPAPISPYQLGFLPGGSGYKLLTTLRTNAQGQALLRTTLPWVVPVGSTVSLQAVHIDSLNGSNPLTRIVDDGIPPCPDDALEENDTPQTATAGQTDVDGISCLNDDDYFVVPVAAGNLVSFDATFDHLNDGDVNLALYSGTGTLIATSTGGGNTEQVSWYNTLGRGANVYVKVSLFGENGGPLGALYNLTTTTITPQPCAPDRFEPNNTLASATPVSPGTLTGLTACAADRDDWYGITLAAGQRLDGNVLHAYRDGDLDIEILDAAGATVGGAGQTRDNEPFSFTAPSSGTFYLRIYPYDDGRGVTLNGNTYSLELSVL